MRYLKANQIMNELKISRPTLKTWKDSGKIKLKFISEMNENINNKNLRII